MKTTVCPQDGNGCSGSNENQSRLERQLEWSRRVGIDELKRIYGASLFLKCMADLFHLLALLALCIGATPVFLDSFCPYTLAKLGGAPILIEMNPDVTLVMLSGKKILVREKPEDIKQRILDYRCRIAPFKNEL